MTKFLKTHGTTLTFALFLVSTVSGVFLFFHVLSPVFHGMHEWLSMVLLVPVAVHVWKNWTAFAGYFRRKTVYVPLVLSLLAGAVFAYPALTAPGGGNPARAAVGALQRGTVAQVAPLFQLTPEALRDRLAAKGYTVTSLDQSLAEIARASGKEGGPGLVAAVAFGK
ncbi:MAG: DUF4405 domain-containing protein [Rhodobacterales bacterium]|nr:DUF4405 domain-containing protein [Rhodobacterales bacterium]